MSTLLELGLAEIEIFTKLPVWKILKMSYLFPNHFSGNDMVMIYLFDISILIYPFHMSYTYISYDIPILLMISLMNFPASLDVIKFYMRCYIFFSLHFDTIASDLKFISIQSAT